MKIRVRLLAGCVAGCLAGLVAPAAAQTLVAPTVLTLGDRDRFGTFLVDNRSAEPQEVTITFKFGYSASDDDGNRYFIYDDSASAEAFGIHDAIRAFPRRFVLAPGQRQIVRMSVRPAADAPDGVYWARIVTASQPVSSPVEETATEGIATQVIFRLEQVTTLLYRKGEVGTGLAAGALGATVDADSLRLRLPLHRTGNAPFYGRARVHLELEAGPDGDARAMTTLAERTDQLLFEVFFDRVIRFDLPLAGLPEGSYRAVVEIDSERPDIPREARVVGEPFTLDAPFAVP